jgi:hypothetical protein
MRDKDRERERNRLNTKNYTDKIKEGKFSLFTSFNEENLKRGIDRVQSHI